MTRFRWVILVSATAAGLAAAVPPGPAADAPGMAVAGAAVLAAADPGPAEDPFPIARVRVTEAQLPDALKQFEPGTLVRLPRDEFEARVRKAGLAAAEARAGPRVVEARYTAALAGGDLAGDAEWTVLNGRPGPAVLPLDPLRLSVADPAWVGGPGAVVGTFGPGFPAGPGLWVPEPGRNVLRFRWSAAGAAGPGERRFELAAPPCPAATLDLTLPADRTPVVPSADVLLAGPFPVPGDDRRQSWRLRFGNQSRLEFGVRGPGAAGSAGAVLASLAARYELSPGQVACHFEYDLRPARGSVAEWAFTLPPGLRVLDVVVNNRAGWRVDPDAKLLTVSLRQPGVGGKVLITAVGPLPAPGRDAPLPLPRPVGAIVGEERVEVRTHPDLEVESLDPADYRIADSSVGPDQTRVVTLTGSLLPAGADEPFRRPPTVRVSGGENEFTTAEGVEWRAEAGRTRLSARVVVRVRRGALFRLAFRTPPGFALDRAAGSPDDLVAYAGPLTAGGPGVVVEFARPVTAGQQADLRLDLRGPAIRAAPGGSRVPFPFVAPVGAAERDGWLALCPGPAWSAFPRPAPGVTEAGEFDFPDPDPPDDAAVTYRYRGIEPAGDVVLTPVRPEFTAAAETRLTYADGRLVASTRLTLKVTRGALPAVAVFEPGPARGGRAWAVAGGPNAVAGVTPVSLGELPGVLPALAAPADALGGLAATRVGLARPPGTDWVVRFARPVTDGVVLETAAAVGTGLSPADARALAAEIATGRREVLAVRGADRTTPRVELAPVLGGGPSPGTTSATRDWSFAGLHLISVCYPGYTLVLFGGSVTAPGGPSLPVRLPPGAEVRAVCVGGHWLDPGRCAVEPRAGGAELRLPVPAGEGPVRFEVRYRLPAGKGRFAREVRSPAPDLPGGPHDVGRWWAFPEGVAAAWPFAARARESAADLPPVLGAPPDRPGGLTVSRFAGEGLSVVPAWAADATGIGLAALVAVLGWVGVRRADRSIGCGLLATLIGTGVAATLGPPAWSRAALPPLVVGLAAVAGVVLARGLRRAGRPARAARVAVTGAAVLMTGPVGLLATMAQPAAADAVFVLTGGEGRETVLAPRDLLDRLDALARPPQPAAVITAATYDGRSEEGLARFTARFVVHSFRDGETAVALPLADVRLEGVTVGGRPAHPVAVRPDLYTVAVTGRGRHEVEARFAVAVAAPGSEREVRFGVPEVPGARLTFTAPGSARQLQAAGRFGGQRVTTEKDAARLDADLGGVRAVQVRWRQGGDRSAVVTAREGCVWDVSEAGARLTACYAVRVEQGAISDLRFELPKDLEPVRVAVRAVGGPTGPPVPAAVLQGWGVGPDKGAGRVLRVDLQGPIEGRLLVVLECAPRGAPTHQPVLRFPRPVGVDSRGGVYGLRANRVAVEGVDRVGVIDFAADALVREFGAVADLRLDPAVTVQAFSPQPGRVAELRPTLRVGSAVEASQEVTWRVGPHRADGAGTIRWQAKDQPVPVLEFALGARVLEVRGPDVAGWAQADGRVQVWFRKPVRDGSVEWVGTLAPSPPGKPPPEPLVFEPPVPTLSHLGRAPVVLRVLPADGWGVRVDRDRGWKGHATREGREQAFTADGPAPPVRLHLFPPRPAAAEGFGLVGVNGPAVVYRVTVELRLPANRPHHLVLRATGLPPGATAELDVPPGTAVGSADGSGAERIWDLDVPASPAGTFRASVVVRFPADSGSVALSAVWLGVGGPVPGPAGVVRWVGVTGAGAARVEGATPAAAADLDAVAARWPGEADRLRRVGGSVWAVRAGRHPVLVPAKAAAAEPPALAGPPAPGSADAGGGEPTASGAFPPTADDRRAVLTAAGWCLGVLALAALFVRLPRSSWPEQIGLLGGLFGVAVAGGWAVGAAAYGLARLGWLARRVAGPRVTRAR